MDHANVNVLDMEKSVAFYKEALDLAVISERTAADGSFRLTFLGDAKNGCKLELTWLRDKLTPYALGDNESHLCFVASDYEAAHAHHKQMGCICFENLEMGLYFIVDPDGYWIEIIPGNRDA